jgi:transcriptional regulator with XRE-family HTH domain
MPPKPTVRRRRLGSTLRRLRNEASLSLDDAAARMGWKAPKLSKIENAVQTIRPAEVATLLGHYGVTDSESVTALESLARDAGRRGWWQTYGEVLPPTYADYIALEADAERLRQWESGLVPGLLQTAAYAREIITAGTVPPITPAEVDARVEVRQARQAVLTRPQAPLELWAVIHEAALHARLARPNVMRDQVRRLRELAELPSVTLQVMPLDGPPHPGLVGSFSLLEFPESGEEVVLIENVLGYAYLDPDNRQVARTFTSAFERIVATALPVEDSLALISRLEEEARTR